MFKKLFLALFLVSSVPVSLVGCKKDDKTEDSDKKKKADDDDDDKGKSKSKKKKADDDSDDDDSKSKKKKKKADDDDDDDTAKAKKKDEDGDSKKKDDTASDDEDSTGVKACDEYLTRYAKCMPGDKKTKTDAVKQMRDAWKKAAAVNAEAKATVKDSCKKADEALDKVPGCK